MAWIGPAISAISGLGSMIGGVEGANKQSQQGQQVMDFLNSLLNQENNQWRGVQGAAINPLMQLAMQGDPAAKSVYETMAKLGIDPAIIMQAQGTYQNSMDRMLNSIRKGAGGAGSTNTSGMIEDAMAQAAQGFGDLNAGIAAQNQGAKVRGAEGLTALDQMRMGAANALGQYKPNYGNMQNVGMGLLGMVGNQNPWGAVAQGASTLGNIDWTKLFGGGNFGSNPDVYNTGQQIPMPAPNWNADQWFTPNYMGSVYQPQVSRGSSVNVGPMNPTGR